MVEKLYTTKQACEILQITRRTLYRWMEDGKINAIKLGETWRISEAELNRITSPNSDNNQ